MQEWKIKKNSGECVRCRVRFEPGRRLFSVLFDRPEGLFREDYCLECFSRDRPGDFFSFWRTTMPQPDAPKRPVINMDAIFDVFRNMRDPSEPSAARLRFLLALMLLRKKRLKLSRIVRRGGREYLVLVEPRVGAEHDVECMELTDAEMEELRDKLSAWMGGSPADDAADGKVGGGGNGGDTDGTGGENSGKTEPGDKTSGPGEMPAREGGAGMAP
ncbi:MAG: hypothetical protein N3A38_05785 [Planctomycetota bacterium]|nr:hypothetical protein [Planctomycetota bacterium]